jgi:predicted transcriptional regulator
MRMGIYEPHIEEKMKLFYDNLSEKDKRYYAAVEAAKLGYGGMQYISNLFKCSRQMIGRGLKELKCDNLLKKGQVRKPGGGRKNYNQRHPSVSSIFFKGD